MSRGATAQREQNSRCAPHNGLLLVRDDELLPRVDDVGVLQDVRVRLEDLHVFAGVVVHRLGDLGERLARLDDPVAEDVGLVDLDVGSDLVLPAGVLLA